MRRKTLLCLFALSLAACSVESKPQTIAGKVNIPNNLANKIGPSDVLYILAYPSGLAESSKKAPESQASTLPNPLAVRKIAPVIFPAKYELSQEDVIFPEKKFEGLMNVVARVQKNPESAPAQKGEFEGAAKKNPVQPGSKNVDIMLEAP